MGTISRISMSAPPACLVCTTPLHAESLDAGYQPLCNRYLRDPAEPEYRHDLRLGICPACGLIQLVTPPPAAEIAPRFPWLSYSEPEGHLDDLTDLLVELAGSGCRVGGISYKDDTTLTRLARRGMETVGRPTPADLGQAGERVEIDAVQALLTAGKAERVARRSGKSDLLIVRHILEHVHDVAGFLLAMRRLVTPTGLVVFEVPDCTGAIDNGDYSTIWEEHLLYFTPQTLRRTLESNGFEVLRAEIYPYPLENSLVAVTRPGRVSPPAPAEAEELGSALAYFAGFTAARKRYGAFLARYRQQSGEIALLGAGHLACTFVNTLGLASHIDCVVDDDPNRQGLFMPGSHLPILSSAALAERQIRLCLMSLNPLNEARVLAKQHPFLDRGGEFHSIFPASSHALAV